MSQENKGLFDIDQLTVGAGSMEELMLSNRPGGIIRVGGQGAIRPVEPFQLSDEGIISQLLRHIIGETDREGLRETPARVVKAWKAMTAGYQQNPADVLKAFEDGAEGTAGQWQIVKDIPIYSNCEHHLLPFFGTATIGYIGNGKVLGLSKLARLADVFAKRLQVQERLTNQVAQALIEHAGADAAMVIINCRHMCMEARGVERVGSSTVTQAFKVGETVDSVLEGRYESRFYQQLKAV